MPSYRTHDRIGLFGSIAAGAIAYIYTESAPAAFWITLSTYGSTLYLSPDLDLWTSRIVKRWGGLAWIWYVYARVMLHRSIWSHSGLLSGTIRFFYLTAWLAPVTYIIDIPLAFYMILWIGMVVADVLHTIADYVHRVATRGFA